MFRISWVLCVVSVFLLLVLPMGCKKKQAARKEPPKPSEPVKPVAWEFPERLEKNIGRKLDPAKLLIYPYDRVLVLNIQGGKETDALFEAEVEKVLCSVLIRKGRCSIVGKKTKGVQNLLKQHAASKALDLSDELILRTAKAVNADKVLTYRILKIEKDKTGRMGEGTQRLIMTRPKAAQGIQLALSLKVIDVGAGTIVAGGTIRERGKGTVFYDMPYPRKIIEPESFGKQKPTEERQLEKIENIGRSYRKYMRWSDRIGLHSLYNDMKWNEWGKKSDQFGPHTLYSTGPGEVLITTTPSNAYVYLNGRLIGKTPLYWNLDEDDKITIYKDGYHIEELRVPPGNSAFHINLRPK